ncbi:MAG: SET domain-containing protein [Pirellulaceae bacterium]
MESQLVEVRETALGKALFATTAIATGEEIGVVSGKIIHDPNYGSAYCIALNEHTSIEPAAPFRFLNHSCEPNCELVIWEYEDSLETQLAVHALAPIAAGSELTIDYAWPADAAINCLCGKSKCRGWIVDVAELQHLPQAGQLAL